MAKVVDVTATVLALSWIGVIFFSTFKGYIRPKMAIGYVLGSAVLMAFAFYITHVSEAQLASLPGVNPIANISAYSQLGFAGIKGTIMTAVFALTSLSLNRGPLRGSLGLLLAVSSLTCGVLFMNLFI